MTDINLQNVTKVFGAGSGAVAAVDDVSLRITSGELFFLLGPSGCGKTTLLRIIAGLIEPTGGRVHFGEKDVTDLPVEQRGTAMVFQNYALWPHMSVSQNVEFGPKMQGADARRRRRLAEENLQRVQMGTFGPRKPNQLSGGQQQRVALARALAAQPDCLLLDEPLSNLDARLRMHMRTELRRLVKATGQTGVYVTHDQAEALSMADRIAVMRDGRIVQIGGPEELYERPGTRFVADFLGEANFAQGEVSAADGVVRIRTGAGEVLSSVSTDFEPGTDVTCCVRPERIELLGESGKPPGDDTAFELPATVETAIYLGEIRQYRCRLADDTGWRVSMLAHRGEKLEEGSKARLRIRAEDVTLLRE